MLKDYKIIYENLIANNEPSGLSKSAFFQAISKQIPREADFDEDINYYSCPRCVNTLVHYSNDPYFYCPFCGQALNCANPEHEQYRPDI